MNVVYGLPAARGPQPCGAAGLCAVHWWAWTACKLSPDYFEAWLLREQLTPGRTARLPAGLVPGVLHPDFELTTCKACGSLIRPWRHGRASGYGQPSTVTTRKA